MPDEPQTQLPAGEDAADAQQLEQELRRAAEEQDTELAPAPPPESEPGETQDPPTPPEAEPEPPQEPEPPAETADTQPAPEAPAPPDEEEVGTTTLELPAELLRSCQTAGGDAPARDGDAARSRVHHAGAQAAARRFKAVGGIVAAAAVLAGLAGAVLAFGLPALEPQTDVPEPTPTAAPTATPAPTPTPTPDPVLEAFAVTESICTGAAPQLKDPAGWDEAGRALMEKLEADPYYQQYGFTAAVSAAPDLAKAMAQALREAPKKERPAWTRSTPGWQEELEKVDAAAENGYPYLLAVNRAASTVTVYAPDAEGRYTVPYMAMVCSGGANTPLGFWSTPIQYSWRLLEGPCYGQYATRIWNGFLFHSVPYYVQHKDDLEYDQFNQLGEAASLGCIRLAVADVKWIYDNCPPGTPVVIYDDADDPGPMGKPGTIATDPADKALRGWDPTDPDPQNPWPAQYRPGTAIRSLPAWEEWYAAAGDGRWDATVNESDLQGWSHDSRTEGTRG